MPLACRRLASALTFTLLTGLTASRRFHASPEMALDVHAKGPLADLEASMDKVNATMSQIISGEGLVGKATIGLLNVKMCTTLCPGLWSKVAWRVASMRKAALAVITAAAGARPWLDVKDLKAVHPQAAIRYKETMRILVCTFLVGVDGSPFQRVLLTLFSSPGFIGRKLTGLTPTGFCFFQEVWEEMKAKGTKPWATWFWTVLLAGCPPVGQPLPEPFESRIKAEHLASGLALAFAGETPEVLEQQKQLFKSVPRYVGCVLKPAKKVKRWIRRELTIEEGQLMWRRSKKCGSNWLGRLVDSRTRTASIAFLAAKDGQEVVQFVKTDAPGNRGIGRDLLRCIKMANPWRKFVFCTDGGRSMERAKNAIEGQLQIIGQETRAAIATSVQLQRLIVDNGGKELKEELASLNSGGHDLEEEEEGSGDETARDLQEITGELGSFADDLNAASQQTQEGASEDQDVASRVIQTVSSGRLPAASTASLVQEASAQAAAVQANAHGQFVGIICSVASSAVTLASVVNILLACQGRNCLGAE